MNRLFPLIILGPLVFSCAGRDGGTPEGLSPKQNLRSVEVVIAEMRENVPEIESFGSISFITKTDISPSVEGIIRRIHVEEGDRVAPNSLLAEIENLQLEIRGKQAEMNIRKAEAALSLAEAEYWEGKLRTEAELISIEKLNLSIKQQARELKQQEGDIANKERLYEVDGISEEQMKKLRLSYRSALTDYENALKELDIKMIGFRDEDIRSRGYTVPADTGKRREVLREINNLSLEAEIEAAEANLASAEAELESAELLLSELRLSSPAEAVVGSKYLEEGERITPGTILFTLFTDERVYAVFPVQERDILFLSEGQTVIVTVPALEDLEFTGTLDLISPTVDPGSGNIMVKAVVANTESALKPGMFVRVKVRYGKPADTIFIPETCISKGNEVFTVVNGRVFRRELNTGTKKDGEIEIKSGLREGDIIVDSPSPALQEGEHVEIGS